MLLHIVARGKIGRSPEAELVDRYLRRISWPTKVTELPDQGGKMPELPPNAASIVLDERGKALASSELASKLESWRDGGKRETWRILHRLALIPPRKQCCFHSLQLFRQTECLLRHDRGLARGASIARQVYLTPPRVAPLARAAVSTWLWRPRPA